MTTSESTKPEAWLSVSFDAGQLGRQLCWTATEGRENLLQITGKFAGSLLLPKGHDLRVEVHGYGDQTLKSFQVLSVCLVTVPADDELPPSPFDDQSTATVQMTDFPACATIIYDPHIDRSYGITASATPLQIRDVNGAWQVSMILTAQIVDARGTRVRVFRFDPESQVGNGTR